MPEVKSLHRCASFCANRTKLRLSCVLVLIRASSQATRKKKTPHIPNSFCANFWADNWGWEIFPQHKAIRVERLQVLEVKFEAADKVYLCGRRSSTLFLHFSEGKRGQACPCPCGGASLRLLKRWPPSQCPEITEPLRARCCLSYKLKDPTPGMEEQL